jgi:hypothetical protein
MFIIKRGVSQVLFTMREKTGRGLNLFARTPNSPFTGCLHTRRALQYLIKKAKNPLYQPEK